MNLPFVMSISGSIVFVLYLCTKPFSNSHLTAHWQYSFLKICLLFYLIPYQCLQNQYLILWNMLFGTGEAVNPLRDGIYLFRAQDTIYVTPDGRPHYTYGIPLLAVSAAWLCVAIIILYRRIRKYRSWRKDLTHSPGIAAAQADELSIPPLLAQSLEKRCRKILYLPYIHGPFTLGLFRPILILPKTYQPDDLPLYLSHELYHIRNHDTLWKTAAFAVILMHWYNPFAYLLLYELCLACEKNCDELVTSTLNNAQKIHYAELIIESARKDTPPAFLVTGAFATNAKQTKERILSMNNRKKCKTSVRNCLTALLICLIAASMPVSVLAYDPVYVYHDDVYYPDSDMCITFNGQSSPFETPDASLDFSMSDDVIIDEDGNQYPVIAEDAQTARACVHEYISGQRNHHVKNGKGCTTYIYEGTYCVKCKICLQETLINTSINTICPH